MGLVRGPSNTVVDHISHMMDPLDQLMDQSQIEVIYEVWIPHSEGTDSHFVTEFPSFRAAKTSCSFCVFIGQILIDRSCGIRLGYC